MIFIMLFVFCIGQIDELIKVRWMTRGIMLFRQPSGRTSTVYKSKPNYVTLCSMCRAESVPKNYYSSVLVNTSGCFLTKKTSSSSYT